MEHNPIIFNSGQYKVLAKDKGGYISVTVRYPSLPNPYTPHMSELIEIDVRNRIGDDEKRIITMWVHDPSLVQNSGASE